MAPSSSSTGAITPEDLKSIVNILEDVSDVLPAPASVIIKLVQRVIAAAEEIRSNRDECDSLKRRLLELLVVVAMAFQKHPTSTSDKAPIPPDLRENVDRLLENLKTIDQEITKIKDLVTSKRKRHKLATVFRAKAHTATLQKCRDDLDWAMKNFDVSSHLSDAIRLWEMSRKVETIVTNQFLENLPRAKYAGFDCERPDKPSTCFEGTRTAVLKLITEWITNPTAERFFWLNGIAGVGKTTVACTIAGLMQNLGLLGGQFCFSRRGEAELRNPALVFPTIAYQLARFDPEFGRRITAALEVDTQAPYASLKQQLDRLIVNPLKGLERDPERVVVLIFDALDECEAQGAKEILQLLVAALPSLPFFLKIFVTSRPERHIRTVLAPETHVPAADLRMTALHDIETSVVKNDILIYLRHRLRELGEERGLPLEWIKESNIELLAEKAGNLFIHIATCIRFLSKGTNPRKQLQTLLKIVGSPNHSRGAANPFVDLDKLYQEILLDVIPVEDPEEVAAELRLVLGSIVLLRDPLPVDALERLISSADGDVSITLQHLHSVILTPPPPDDCPRPYHPSFPDFLQNHSRCTDDRLWISTEEHEGRMALRCLELLNSKLHKGMLRDIGPTLLNSEVEDLEAKVKAVFTPELQYACRFWASHLKALSASNAALEAALEIFASRFMLPWMECMSWLGDVDLAIRCLRDANFWATASLTKSPAKALLYDGHRLLLAHNSAISLGAQHIAQSVLPFAPSNTPLTSHYRDYANSAIKVLFGAESEWSAVLVVWTGHSAKVTSVAVSPDGSSAASGSEDRTVRIWDLITGACTSVLEGHSESVRSVAFSPDGTQIASGSVDRTVRIWDVVTGACTAVLGHSDMVNSVVFSPDGSTVASGSRDGSIRLWSRAQWSCAAFIEQVNDIMSLAFFSDGLRLASGSRDGTVRIWDTMARTHIRSLKSQFCESVALSPDGSCVVSASSFSLDPFRMWDTITNSCTLAPEGFSQGVEAVAFSQDGFHLAIGCSDAQIWDPATMKCITTFRGHSGFVTSVAFTPNGSRLITGSADSTVRLWDTAIMDSTVSPEGHSSYVYPNTLAFSPDGSRLITGSFDKTARIWDTTSGHCIATLKGHSQWISATAFHPDGLHVATGSHDYTVRIWDARTGRCMAIFHAKLCGSLIFSSNGAFLRDEDVYHTIRIWDLSTGKQLEQIDESQFEGRTDETIKISDGRLFRSAADGSDNLLCLLPPLEVSTGFFCNVYKMRKIPTCDAHRAV